MTKTAQVRHRQHWKQAAAGRKTPRYDWLRQQHRDDVVVDDLDWADELDELAEAEIPWIALLRHEGQPLRNLAAGGLGPTGVEWTAKMRQAAGIRATGRKIPSRFGEEIPFYQRERSPEQWARWSAARKGTNIGADNPNYGKFGADHPGGLGIAVAPVTLSGDGGKGGNAVLARLWNSGGAGGAGGEGAAGNANGVNGLNG